MHTKDARAIGETEQRLYALPAWLETPFFTGRERAALAFTESVTLLARHGGTGPPLLLLHGHPRTHMTWHRVAPLLAGDHTVVCPDLRGYGESSKPPTTPDHAPYSKQPGALAGSSRAV
jgi:haloacetate dehalogenase